jgi:hypothetical protein
MYTQAACCRSCKRACHAAGSNSSVCSRSRQRECTCCAWCTHVLVCVYVHNVHVCAHVDTHNRGPWQPWQMVWSLTAVLWGSGVACGCRQLPMLMHCADDSTALLIRHVMCHMPYDQCWLCCGMNWTAPASLLGAGCSTGCTMYTQAEYSDCCQWGPCISGGCRSSHVGEVTGCGWWFRHVAWACYTHADLGFVVTMGTR